MKITPPADDFGTETLRRNNLKKVIEESDHVEPYPSIEPSKQESPRGRPQVDRRRAGDRRKGKGERRQRKGRALHSTRSSRERRTLLRRKGDNRIDSSGEQSDNRRNDINRSGIDEFT